MNKDTQQLQSYLLWLNSRGVTHPIWQESYPDSLSTQPDSESQAFKVIFISDLPLQAGEIELLTKMATAMNLSPNQWETFSSVLDPSFLKSGIPGADVLDDWGKKSWSGTNEASCYVPLGPLATRIVCGKGRFTNMRGQTALVEERRFVPTFHPRDILRDAALKRDVWQDLQKVQGLV